MTDNHYTVLGLEPSASDDAIRTALASLERQAEALAYTAPHRSHQLWATVRRIRADLLQSPERRVEYDRALEQARTLYVPVLAPPAEGVAGSRNAERGWLLGGVVAGIVLAAAALAALLVPSVRRPAPVDLAAVPLSPAAEHLASGQRVTLRWRRVPGAAVYRLRLESHPSRRPVSVRTILTLHTWYTVRVVGAQRYLWRVQALVGGRWERMSRSRLLVVARPRVSAPAAMSPENGARLAASRFDLCWAPVPGATLYALHLAGHRIRTRDRCHRVALHAGSYRWSVRALARGTHLYRGPASRTQRFQVIPLVAARTRPARTAAAKPAASTPAVHAVGTRRPADHASPVQQPVIVAVVYHLPSVVTPFHPARGSSGTRVSHHRVHRAVRRAQASRARRHARAHHSGTRGSGHPSRLASKRRHKHHRASTGPRRARVSVPVPVVPPTPAVALAAPATRSPVTIVIVSGAVRTPVPSVPAPAVPLSQGRPVSLAPTVPAPAPAVVARPVTPALPVAPPPVVVVPQGAGEDGNDDGNDDGQGLDHQHSAHPHHPAHPPHPPHP